MSNDFSEEKLKAQFIGGLEEYINEAIPKFAEKINNHINEDYETKQNKSHYAGFKELQLKKPVVVEQDEKEKSKKPSDKKTKGKKPKDEKNKSNVSESNKEINQSKKK